MFQLAAVPAAVHLKLCSRQVGLSLSSAGAEVVLESEMAGTGLR